MTRIVAKHVKTASKRGGNSVWTRRLVNIPKTMLTFLFPIFFRGNMKYFKWIMCTMLPIWPATTLATQRYPAPASAPHKQNKQFIKAVVYSIFVNISASLLAEETLRYPAFHGIYFLDQKAFSHVLEVPSLLKWNAGFKLSRYPCSYNES